MRAHLLTLVALGACQPEGPTLDETDSTPSVDTAEDSADTAGEDSGDTDDSGGDTAVDDGPTWTWGTDNDSTVADATLVGTTDELAGVCLLGVRSAELGDDLLIGAPFYDSNHGRVYRVPARASGWTQGESLATYPFLVGDEETSQMCRALPQHFSVGALDDYVFENSYQYVNPPGLVQVVRGDSWTTSSVPIVATIDNTDSSGSWEYVKPGPTLGDLDGDGLDDLFLSEEVTGRAYVVSGADITGSINAPDHARLELTTSAPYPVYASEFGDLDGDGVVDIVAKNDALHTLYIISGTQTGGPTDLATAAMTHIDCDDKTWTRAIGDIDGDGLDDLWLTTEHRGTVYFFGRESWPAELTLGDADLESPEWLGPLQPVGDLDGDSLVDFAQVDGSSSTFDLDVLLWWGGTAWPPSLTSAGADVVIHGGTSSIGLWRDPSGRVPDIDGDGLADLVLTNGSLDVGTIHAAGAISVFTGRTTWPSTLTAADADVRFVGRGDNSCFGCYGYRLWTAVLDLNGDGYDDIAAFDHDTAADLTGATAVFFGKAK